MRHRRRTTHGGRILAILLCLATLGGSLLSGAPAQAGTEGTDNTYYGDGAGNTNSVSGNSFVGVAAGTANEGTDNSFFGDSAGSSNTTGNPRARRTSSSGTSRA